MRAVAPSLQSDDLAVVEEAAEDGDGGGHRPALARGYRRASFTA